jgi:predicted CXXCH cytochrome family protein
MVNESDGHGLFVRTLFALLMSCLIQLVNSPAGFAGSSEDCIACHADVWGDIQSKRYVHRPAGKGDCRYCHIAVQEGKDLGGLSRDKVKWVARGINPGREHWLEFDDSKRGATLLVEARSGRRIKVEEFPLPALDELEELASRSLLPLTINEVRLLEVAKGIFVSATIAWETDRPADSQVFYGLDGKLNQSSILDRQLVTNHAVMLIGVHPGKFYKYKVVSVDEAGNRTESDVKSVIMDVVRPEALEETGRLDVLEPEIKAKSYRKGSKFLVVVSANQAVTVRLGILPKKYSDDDSDGPKVVRHMPLSSQAETTIGVCYTCHVEYKKILSHPINVYPKRGMTIPPEYSTLSDGRISCMSCHVAHASNVEFRVVKADKKELCRGCHPNMG